jgi:hypothetical protein
MKETIAYKVVGKITRYGTNATGSELSELQTKKIIEENPKFFPRYKKGEVIKAVKGSQGIYCFLGKKDAINFKNQYDILREKARIVKVIGYGSPNKNPLFISSCMQLDNLINSFDDEEKYTKWKYRHCYYVSIATFKTIKVLE